MDRQAQIDFILDHYENPRHYGAVEDATVTQKGGNPGCGDIVTFYLRLGDDSRIEDISFEGEGCTISQAASSMVTEMFHGKTLEDVENTPADVKHDKRGGAAGAPPEAIMIASTSSVALDVQRIRADFPILQREVKGKRLVYLDNAASSQKPIQVLDAMDRYYRETHANVHRGVHTLSEEATTAYEGARAKVSNFIGACCPKEVIWTRNATEAINLVAYSWGRSHLKQGDRVLLTEMEHHANLVPWQILAAEKGVELDFVRVADNGALILDDLPKLLTPKTKLFGFSAASNVLGTLNPVNAV